MPEEEYDRLMAQERIDQQREIAEANRLKEQELRAVLSEKISAVRNSRAPKNCVVEVYGRAPGLFGKYGIREIHPAFYLGPWTKSYDPHYDNTDTYYYAITGDGVIYHNHAGVGERQEFRVGKDKEWLNYDREYHVKKLGGSGLDFGRNLPYIEVMERVIELPGWKDALDPMPKADA